MRGRDEGGATGAPRRCTDLRILPLRTDTRTHCSPRLQGDDKMATRVSAWLVSDGCVVGAAAARQAEVVADADRQVRKANKNRTKVHACENIDDSR